MWFNISPRVTALSGVLAALMTLLVIFFAGFYQPGFSHGQSFVSELNASGSLFANVIGYLGFLPVGVVTLFFIGRLKQELYSSKRVTLGLILLGFSGLDWWVTAVFPCDAGCPTTGDISVSQMIHNISGLLSTLLVPIGIGVLMGAFQKMRFNPLVIVFSITSIVAYIASFVLIVTHVFEEFQGGIQRLNILIFYSYICVLSVNIYFKKQQTII